MRSCDRCSSPLPALVRADARFCSTRCRVASHRTDRIPPVELRQRDRWVRRSAAKVPMQVTGRAASSTDPATWTTWADAEASSVGVGVGFVLNGDGIVCLDLDGCLVDGVAVDWAQQVLDRCPGTWVTVSPSGNGLHVWGFADFDSGTHASVGGHRVEVYGSARYITVTGVTFGARRKKLGDISGAVSWLIGG
jgi:primase-polymerase (primpol)-like protein